MKIKGRDHGETEGDVEVDRGHDHDDRARMRAWSVGDFNDLYRFDPDVPAWTNLSGSPPPPPRDLMGFAADDGGSGGRLFVFGGWSCALGCACAGRACVFVF